jgi:hypothetical protein
MMGVVRQPGEGVAAAGGQEVVAGDGHRRGTGATIFRIPLVREQMRRPGCGLGFAGGARGDLRDGLSLAGL